VKKFMITIPPNLTAKGAPGGKKVPSKLKKAVKAPKTVGPTKKSTSVAPTKTATRRKAATPENEDTHCLPNPRRKLNRIERRARQKVSICILLENGTILNSTPFAVTLTAYILVEKNQPSQHPGRKNAKIAENDRFVQREPFQFKDTDGYASFLVKIS